MKSLWKIKLPVIFIAVVVLVLVGCDSLKKKIEEPITVPEIVVEVPPEPQELPYEVIAKLQATKACKKAFRPIVIPESVEMSDSTWQALYEYKKLWIYFCMGNFKDEEGFLSMEPILLKSWTLFNNNFFMFDKLEYERREDLYKITEGNIIFYHSKLTKLGIGSEFDMDEVIPAIYFFNHAEYIGHQYTDYRELLPLLNEREIKFIEFMLIHYETWQYTEQKWSHGGCTKFGEVDWSAEIKTYDQILPQYSGEYKKKIQWYNRAIQETLLSLSYCTCKEKAAVALDIEQIIKKHHKNPKRQQLIRRLKEQLKKIKAGEIEIKSDALNECSYG